MIILIDGRPELLEEVGQADKDLKAFITEGVQTLMALDGVGYVIESSGSVQANPGRGQIIHRRMKALASA